MAKTLRVGYLMPANNLDPRGSWDVESSFVIRHVFETPFDTVYGGTDVAPQLFREPLRAVPGRTSALEADLREDIRFSDGTTLTAEDVVRSLSTAAPLQHQAEVRAEGDRVVFVLRRPNARFDLVLSNYQCSVFRHLGASAVGTGPYQIAPGSTASCVRLVRNPYYRRPVAIDEVQFQTYPPDPDGRARALIAALETGEVDLSLSLGRDDIDAVKGVRKTLLPGVSLALLYLNCESPRLSDRRVRSAIARCIDRLAIATSCYSNPLAFSAISLVPRPLGSADIPLDYDLPAARALLDEAPTVPEVLRLRMPWGPRPYLAYPQRVGDLVAEQIRQLGIRIEFVPTATSSDFMKSSIDGSYDLTLAGWVADTMDPCDFLESNLASQCIPHGGDSLAVSSNLGRLRSPELDSAIEAYRGDRKEEHLREITGIVGREVPLVPLMYGPAASVRTYRVQNFRPTALWYVPIEELDVTA